MAPNDRLTWSLCSERKNKSNGTHLNVFGANINATNEFADLADRPGVHFVTLCVTPSLRCHGSGWAGRRWSIALASRRLMLGWRQQLMLLWMMVICRWWASASARTGRFHFQTFANGGGWAEVEWRCGPCAKLIVQMRVVAGCRTGGQGNTGERWFLHVLQTG